MNYFRKTLHFRCLKGPEHASVFYFHLMVPQFNFQSVLLIGNVAPVANHLELDGSELVHEKMFSFRTVFC